MKKKAQIAVVLIMLILEPWIASLTYCEILTAKFSNSDLVTVCESNDMIGSIDTLKVLEKNPRYLKVYVRNKQGGHVMLLENNKNYMAIYSIKFVTNVVSLQLMLIWANCIKV